VDEPNLTIQHRAMDIMREPDWLAGALGEIRGFFAALRMTALEMG
jgi:hypothetical protein